jgi:predicted secreted protein
MANNSGVYTGESGVIKFVGDDSTVASVASVRSFSVDREVQTIETTTMGDTNRSYTAGLAQFSGSLDVYLRDDDAGQTNFLSYVENPDSVAKIELFPSGETTGIKLAGNVIVTGHSITSNFDGAVEASITFQGTGALTRTETS